MKYRWLLWVCGIILLGNFFILRLYGDALQSTHLFIVRGTVFYPAAYLNLIAGALLIALLVRDLIAGKRR